MFGKLSLRTEDFGKHGWRRWDRRKQRPYARDGDSAKRQINAL